jgi:hypothetical protein
VTFNETPWIGKGDPVPGIGANQRFTDEAWTTKVGTLSTTPITTTRGTVFVKPAEERPAGVPPFAEIKARLTMDYQAERRDEEAITKLTPASQELASGTPLATLAGRYETDVKTTPEFAPGGTIPDIGSAPELSTKVFATAKGQAGPPVPVPGGFVLFRVVQTTARPEDLRHAEGRDPRDASGARGGPPGAGGADQDARGPEDPDQRDLLKSFLPEPGASPRRG